MHSNSFTAVSSVIFYTKELSCALSSFEVLVFQKVEFLLFHLLGRPEQLTHYQWLFCYSGLLAHPNLPR